MLSGGDKLRVGGNLAARYAGERGYRDVALKRAAKVRFFLFTKPRQWPVPVQPDFIF